MATASMTAFSSIFSISNASNPRLPSALLPSPPWTKTRQDFSQLNFLRGNFLNGHALMPLLFLSSSPPSKARKVEVGSYLPSSSTDPSFVVFEATPKDTPALRAAKLQGKRKKYAIRCTRPSLSLTVSSSIQLL